MGIESGYVVPADRAIAPRSVVAQPIDLPLKRPVQVESLRETPDDLHRLHCGTSISWPGTPGNSGYGTLKPLPDPGPHPSTPDRLWFSWVEWQVEKAWRHPPDQVLVM